jgi:LytS/YehU family sensor histidine kinase
LQPILENAIRHGMGAEKSELDIEIDVSRAGAAVEVRVRDNGVGIATPALQYGHGLSNVNSRLVHAYGDGSVLRVAQLEPNGTEVCLQFPLRA